MSRKSTLFALAAALTLGVAMLNPVIASAAPGGHGGGHGGGMHHSGGHAMHGGGHGFRHVGHHGRHFGHNRHYWHRNYVRWQRPIWYAAPVVYASYAARPVVAGPCTCLTKEYTPEGAVLFKDRCTDEMAMNPPEAPQQTGMIDQQPQTAQYQQQYVQPRPESMTPK